MTSFTVTAFRWSGTHYNATYNTSYRATFNDDDASYDGGSDGSETVSINGGAEGGTLGSPYTIRVSFRDADGVQHSEEFHFFNAGGAWYFVPGPESAFGEGATLGSYQGHTVGWDYESVTCFASGTRISTPSGPCRVEDLGPGDRVLEADGTIRRLRLNLSRGISAADLEATAAFRPVRIVAGALGAGLPHRDLRVSRQHRMLVRSPIARRMFGCDEVLVAAIRLTALPGMFIDPSRAAFDYHHLVFDSHAIVLAEGAPSESFFPGPEGMRVLCPRARAEFAALFPASQAGGLPRPARMIPPGAAQKHLIRRHCRNAKPLLA